MILHEFFTKHNLSGFALSRVDDAYVYSTSESLEILLSGDGGKKSDSPAPQPRSFRQNLNHKFREYACVYVY